MTRRKRAGIELIMGTLQRIKDIIKQIFKWEPDYHSLLLYLNSHAGDCRVFPIASSESYLHHRIDSPLPHCVDIHTLPRKWPSKRRATTIPTAITYPSSIHPVSIGEVDWVGCGVHIHTSKDTRVMRVTADLTEWHLSNCPVQSMEGISTSSYLCIRLLWGM